MVLGRSLLLQPPEEFDEALTEQVLGELGYTLIDKQLGFHYYADRSNVQPLFFDFNRGSVPIKDFVRALENEGINLDTFYAVLEAI